LSEHVEHGPWITPDPALNQPARSKDADTVIASVPLAEHVELDPTRPLRYQFTLPIPPRLPGPCMQTPDFSLRWTLRALVGRQLHPDPMSPSICTE